LNEPVIQYKSSRWTNLNGETVSQCFVYDDVQVEVIVENPMRKQRVTNLLKVTIYKDNNFLPDSYVKQDKHIVTLPPLSTGKIAVPFKPTYEAEYHYEISIENERVYSQPKGSPPRLYASRRNAVLIIDEPLSIMTSNPGLTVTGRLISAENGEGIEGAKIGIYDVRTLRKDDLIAYGVTSKNGIFTIGDVKSKALRWNKRLRIYVKFFGDDVYKPVVSNQYTINIQG
jgi:hypothetical protein